LDGHPSIFEARACGPFLFSGGRQRRHREQRGMMCAWLAP